MIEILKMHEFWFGAAAVVGSLLIGYVAYEIASFHFRRKKEAAEREPDVDYNQLQRDLDEEFGTPAEVKAARLQ